MLDEAQRIAMLTQMFATYGQEAATQRMRGYLEILAPIPTASLGEAIKGAMAEAEKGWPPGPGEIVTGWKANRGARPEERPYRATARPAQSVGQIDSGPVMAQIEALVEPSSRSLFEVARELRKTNAKNFPIHPTDSRTPSLVAAAMKIWMRWPMPPDHDAQVTDWMVTASDAGQDVGWWDSGKRKRVTQWSGSYDLGPLAWRPEPVPAADEPPNLLASESDQGALEDLGWTDARP